MPTPTLAIEDVLAPISPEHPSGEDLRATEDWVKIRTARPNTDDIGGHDLWTPLEASKASWEQLRELSLAALEKKSKDLRIAIWFTEANLRLHAFAGLRDSLLLIRELVTRFWDTGLYPEIEDGDLEMRAGPLEWLNGKLDDALREISLTRRNEPGEDYSFAYYQESRRPQGRISISDFEAAVRGTKLEAIEETYRDLLEAADELKQLDAACSQRFGTFAPSFSDSRATLDAIRVLLERILRDKRPAAPPDGRESSTTPDGAPSFGAIPGFEGGSANGTSWAEAERLARSGKTDEALREMTRLAAAEGSGRARFQRKLMLAEICLSSRRDGLAKVILEELAEMIEKHQLEMWETTEVIGGVWTRLYGCYKNEKAGTADGEKAASLFLKLCRLDPWQALRCSDPRD